MTISNQLASAGNKIIRGPLVSYMETLGNLAGASAGAVKGCEPLDHFRKWVHKLPPVKALHAGLEKAGIKISPLEVTAAANIAAAGLALPFIVDAFAPGLGLLPLILCVKFGLMVGEAISSDPTYEGIGAFAGWEKGGEKGGQIGREIANNWFDAIGKKKI